MNIKYKVSSVDLKNAILATPLTKDGRIRMGKAVCHREVDINEFLNRCFVDADFISQDILAEKINTARELRETEDYDHFACHTDTQKKYKYNIKRRSEHAQKENFEKDLLGLDDSDLDRRTYSTIYLIEGPAGSGKTTYANFLLRNNFVVDTCDVETATQTSCSCFSTIYDFQKKQTNPITAIEVLLLSSIHRRLAKGNEESDEEYIHRLSQICEIYNNQFNSSKIIIKDSREFRTFFETLSTFCYTKRDYDFLTYSFLKQINNSIYFDNRESDNKPSYDTVETIRLLMGILMRIYFCLSIKDQNKYILFLDNIERFIISETGKPYISVFDADLQKILNSIYSIADETEDVLFKTFNELHQIDNQIQYRTTFGVLITVRESTLSVLRNNHAFTEYFEQHHSENVPTYVNISNWFDYSKVFEKKIEFFLGITDEDHNLYTHAFKNILNDITLSKWSLRRLLLNLFNNNFRRFFENMTEVFCNYEEVVKYYNSMWDNAKNIASPQADRVRHLCRKLILHIVLDYMQNTKDIPDQIGFFDSLMARCDNESPTNDYIAKASYARRILTFLDNQNNLYNSRPIAFPELIEVILHKPIIKSFNKSNVSINDKRIDDIAEILAIASQSAKIHTHGVELVYLNADSTKLKNSTLSLEMKQQWNRFRTIGEIDGSLFNIKIAPAGSVLALLFPSFEYFSCRYMTNSVPLFMLKSELDRKELLFGPKDGNGIYNKAITCIDAVLKYETRFLALGPIKKKQQTDISYAHPKWIFDYDGAGAGIVHPLRIILDHIGYLRDYKEFLADINDPSYDNYHYKENDGQGVIDDAINRYKQKYIEITKTFQTYLNLGYVPHG